MIKEELKSWIVKEIKGIIEWDHLTADDVYFDLKDLVKRIEKEK